MAQQLVIQPLGIVTQPGELTMLPPGAMSVAENIYIRSPYKIEVARPWQISASAGEIGVGLRGWMLPAGKYQYSLMLAESSSGTWKRNWQSPQASGSFFSGGFIQNEDGTAYKLREDGNVWTVEASGLQYVNTDCGTMCIERIDPNVESDVASSAGLRAPFGIWDIFRSDITSQVGALAWGYGAAWVATIRRNGKLGTSIVSPPCAPFPFTFSEGLEPSGPATYPACNTNGYVYFESNFVRAGDFVDVYRTRSQKQLLESAYTSLGADYFRVASVQITSTDISNGYVIFKDTTPDNGLGEALYTNDGFHGPQGIALQPPAAACMAQWKGYTFYGDIKQPAQYSGRAKQGWAESGVGNYFGTFFAHVSQTSGNPVLTVLTDSPSITSFAVGQAVTGLTGIPGSTVTAVGSGTVTISPAPTTTSADTYVLVNDKIELNGSVRTVQGPLSQTGVDLGFVRSSVRAYALNNVAVTQDPTHADWFRSQTIVDFTIREERLVGLRSSMPTFTLRATRGRVFDPPIPDLGLGETAATYSPVEQPDGWCCSEQHQPWRVPLSNYERMGEGIRILAIVPTKDCLYWFTTKGLKRMTGSGGDAGSGFDWEITPVDETLILTGPRAWCVLRDTVYARTSRGVVAIDPSGTVQLLTEGVIGDIFPSRRILPDSAYVAGTSTCVWMMADEQNGEVILYDWTASATSVYRYNIVTKTWVTDQATLTTTNIHHGAVFPYDSTVMVFRHDGSNRAFYAPNLGVVSTWPAWRAHFQPISGDNPFEQKFWQSLDPMFSASSALTSVISVVINGTTWLTAESTQQEVLGIRRASFSVPRDAPADAPAISFGFNIAANAVQAKLVGVAVHFFQESTGQRKHR